MSDLDPVESFQWIEVTRSQKDRHFTPITGNTVDHPFQIYFSNINLGIIQERLDGDTWSAATIRSPYIGHPNAHTVKPWGGSEHSRPDRIQGVDSKDLLRGSPQGIKLTPPKPFDQEYIRTVYLPWQKFYPSIDLDLPFTRSGHNKRRPKFQGNDKDDWNEGESTRYRVWIIEVVAIKRRCWDKNVKLYLKGNWI